MLAALQHALHDGEAPSRTGARVDAVVVAPRNHGAEQLHLAAERVQAVRIAIGLERAGALAVGAGGSGARDQRRLHQQTGVVRLTADSRSR